jgi:hypothetical protein
MNASIDFSEISDTLTAVEGVHVDGSYFPIGVDVANGDSVTLTITYDGRDITSAVVGSIARADDWKFGDILSFGPLGLSRFMLISAAPDHVTVLTLDDDFDDEGTIQSYYRDALQRVEEA